MRPKFSGIWATEPPNPTDIQAPPLAVQKRGWPFEGVIPYQWANWLWHIATGWSGQLAKHGGAGYDTLDEAASDPDFPAGATAFVDEYDKGRSAIQVAEYATGLEAVACVTATARSVLVLGHASAPVEGTTVLELRRFDRDGTPSATTFPVAGVYGAADLWSDGKIVVVASRALVECFDHETGEKLWDSGTLTNRSRRRLAGDHRFVYATDGAAILRFTRADGTSTALTTAANEWFDIVSDGLRVYGMHANVLSLINAESGVGSDVVGVWPDGGRICVDANLIYVAGTSGGDWTVQALRHDNGDEVWALASDIANISRMRHDGEWIWIAGDGEWVKLDPRTGNVWAKGGASVVDVGVDGCAVWAVGPGSGGGTSLQRVNRGNTKRLWRRVDVTAETVVPLQQEVVPA